MNGASNNKLKKVALLYVLFIILFSFFLIMMFVNAVKSRHLPSKFSQNTERAKRGSIISYDGFHIASTEKLYKVLVNTKNIDPDKFDLFIELFHIYSGIDIKEIKKRLKKRKGSVVLSYSVSAKDAQYLKSLAYELLRLHVFKEYVTKSGRIILHGLSVVESGERRVYNYGKLLTPVIGYPRKMDNKGYTKVYGVQGLEKYYDDELSASQDGLVKGYRDVNSYIILNKKSNTKESVNGMDIVITIPVTLQIRVEKILSHFKKELEADEIMAVIMESKTGRILSLASSNRFNPSHIKRSDYPSLRTGAISYSFEPGSVIKPMTFSMLLEQHLVNPYEIVNGHNGRFKIGRKLITDEHRFQWLSAENVIVHSSNVGIAQLAQKLNGLDFHEGLLKFGFSQKSGIDLPYEKAGSIRSIRELNDEIYKATSSYGYGMRVNLMQLIKAYSAFNNNGREVTPYLVDHFENRMSKITPERVESEQVISAPTAKRMKRILIKTVLKGTGVKTITEGIEVGGKTGTAHLVEHGKYVRKYNTSFIGFANDKSSHYTVGVVVIQPKKNHFASQTAVVTYKAIIDTLVSESYLVPSL